MQQEFSWTDQTRVTHFVRDHYRTADVFRKHHISFCCGGNVPLLTVCQDRALDCGRLLLELQEAANEQQLPSFSISEEWPLDFLVDYIMQVHHRYVDSALSANADYLSTFLFGHQQKFPDLVEVERLYQQMEKELRLHIRQEREVLFPYIKQVYHAYTHKAPYAGLLVRTLRKPVEEMIVLEQNGFLQLLNEIRRITNDYFIPEKACPQQLVCFSKLKELDQQVRQQLQLENRVLFPRAVAMEKELLLAV